MKYFLLLLGMPWWCVFLGCRESTITGLVHTDIRNYPLHKTVSDDIPERWKHESLEGKDGFIFKMVVRLEGQNFRMITVRGDGSIVDQRRVPATDTGSMRIRNGKLSTRDVRELQSLLDRARFLSMKKEYHANVHDGATVLIEVQSGEIKKDVFCDNHFPGSIVKIWKAASFLYDVAEPLPAQ